MKLKDCVLEVHVAVFNEESIIGLPDQHWTEAKERSLIPSSLFKLFTIADHFGFEKCPRFLSDSQKLLFPYLEAMTTGIRDSLVEADRLFKNIKIHNNNSYSPVKEKLGLPFDSNAVAELDRSFKYMLVNLTGALDQFAEIVGVILFPKPNNLTPGRASFRQIMTFVNSPLQEVSLPTTCQEHFAGNLHNALSNLISPTGTNKEWIELLFLYRNKLAHLGSSMFQSMCFHDAKCEFYTFLPRQWPTFFKQKMTLSQSSPGGSAISLKDEAEKELLHCDIVEYSQGLIKSILTTLEAGLSVMCDAYVASKDLSPREIVATAILKQSESYQFEYFP